MKEMYEENKGIISFYLGMLITSFIYTIFDYLTINEINKYLSSEEGEKFILGQCEVIKYERGKE